MSISRRAGLPCVMILQACSAVAGQSVTSPEAHLGRPPGTDFELADWAQVSSYFIRLGDESPNVVTRNLGTTTEGRDFLLSIISSPENLADLDRIREHAAVIADPRGVSETRKRQAVEAGKVVLLVSPQMHSSETAGTEAGMVFAHRLATSREEPWVTARANMVVGIFACTNPDGLDHVVHWYREHVGTPYEATGMLKLYQLYAGHDNNRDWFMLTQNETRMVTEQLYSVWHPQVYWDMHQQGSTRERMFVPPFRDPLNPNLDPAIIAGIDAIGSRALLDMTRAGLTGISTGVTYDMWWNGGNRNVPVRHNIIGLLTEAASVDVASPIFLGIDDLSPPRGLDGYVPSNRFPAPWPGGWWRLGDINRYQVAFGESLVRTLGREPRTWLKNALEASERTIRKGVERGPRAWVIPSDNRDPDAVRRLADVLRRSGIEMGVAPGPLTADGRTYPAGSIVVRRDQPYGSHAKDLLEVQRYPDGAPPYDVAGWTLPYLLGVRRVEVMEALDVPPSDGGFADAFRGDDRVAADGAGPAWSTWHSGTWSTVFDRLAEGERFTFVGTGDRAGLIVPASTSVDEHTDRPIELDRLPRIGLYAPWRGNMDEGWMRYWLDDWEIPYVRVRNEMLRAGQLGDFIDALIIPGISGGQLDAGRTPGTIPDEFARGLDPEGAVAVEEFVRGGGTLVTLGASSQWAIDLLRLPLVDVTREDGNSGFSCPGSVLRGVPVSGPSFTAGLPDSLGLFFSRSSAWRTMTGEERVEAGVRAPKLMRSMLEYAPTRVLLSGWINEPEVIRGRMAWVHARYGDGHAHLFGFRPQYRGWTQATVPLVFRAVLLSE